jgi:uncharacterized peroxidase-related enzyme
MTDFTIHSTSSAPESSRKALAEVEKALGFVPNLFGILAESPAALQGYLGLASTLDRGTLTAAERELINIAVSTENRCEYCVAAHSTLAALGKVEPALVEAVRASATLPDRRVNALVGLARELVRQRGFASASTVAAFIGAGYNRAQLLEVAGRVGLKTFANLVNNVAQTPLDEAFEPQRWQVRLQKAS